MKQLMMDLVGVTEAAALASAPWIGRGIKHEADEAATEAMRSKLNQISMDATIVIGEGELDEAPMLYIGEKVGTGEGLKLDVAVDPLEGTSLVAKGQGNSITVIAVAPKGCLLHAPDMYMEKIAVGPKAAGKIDIDTPLIENMKIVAEANGKAISDLTIAVLDREKNQKYIQVIQEAGAKVQLFSDGDVTYSIATALEGTGIDMFVGIGGAPEGVVSAVALKCLGGDMQGRLLPSNHEEYDRCLQMGLSQVDEALRLEQLISSNQCIFAATGITESILLKGIEKDSDKQITHSFLAYGNEKRLHFIESVHNI
ncbi:class II fructose-bisphosphatase [Ammoniphilus sp. 3BR4]|uniref:class II fructose-bisphosphatase n=1 Tax=Ammoniphilus sp. 3BR4 TaxID=3158265 RepID=UPI0034652E0C